MSTTPFTIVDGVPREILAAALSSSAARVASEAQGRVIDAAQKVLQYAQYPGGNSFPEPERLVSLLAVLMTAYDNYVAQKAIADRVHEQALEIQADGEEAAS